MNPSSGGELGPSHFSVLIYKIAMILSATKIFFFFLVMPLGLWDLNSLTRD